MTLQQIEQAASSLTTWIIGAVGGGVIWLFRQVMTNQAQIRMLQSEIKSRDDLIKEDWKARDQLRKEDRELLQETRTEVKEMRKEIRDLFRRSDNG